MPSTNLEQFAPLVAATLFAPAVIFLAFSLMDAVDAVDASVYADF